MIKTIHSEKQSPPLPIWSGILTFGLLSLPILLLPASRDKAVSSGHARAGGPQLRIRYLCEKDNRRLERNELARSQPAGCTRGRVSEGQSGGSLIFENNHEIALRRFALLDEIDPAFFNLGYLLAPGSGAHNAYRLLAQSMAEERRAGIATVGIENRAGLVAITAERDPQRTEPLWSEDEHQRQGHPPDKTEPTEFSPLTREQPVPHGYKPAFL